MHHIPKDISFARECAVRDAYANDLAIYRPGEFKVSREALPARDDLKRADLVTVDPHNHLRVWEFKLRATPAAIGQVLVYLALCRRHYKFARVVRGVLAAAHFEDDTLYAIEALNLCIETVQLPVTVLNAGRVAFSSPEINVPHFAL